MFLCRRVVVEFRVLDGAEVYGVFDFFVKPIVRNTLLILNNLKIHILVFAEPSRCFVLSRTIMFLLFCPDLGIRSLIGCLENRGTLTIAGVVVPKVMCSQLWFSSFELELEAVSLWLQTPILVQL